jgi:uncharacterized lipoprotein YajG
MKFLLPFVKILTLCAMVLLLLGATKEGTITIHITPGQPVGPVSLVSPTSAAKIKVSTFQDGRTGKLDPYMIGRRTPGNITIYSYLPVFEIVTEAVKSELMRKGYRTVQENGDFSIKGKITQYWVTTPVKWPKWDVEGEVAFTMEVNWPGQKVFNILGPYNGRKIEKVKFMPNQEMIKRVLEGALMEAIQAMSSDPNLSNALSKKP